MRPDIRCIPTRLVSVFRDIPVPCTFYKCRRIALIKVSLLSVMLMPDDFRSFSKIKIDNHSFNKENLPSHFKVSSH
jgi:hypothetical protein